MAEQEQKQKQILVICSSPSGSDFNSLQNNKLKNELFGENPIYTFCDGNTLEMRFPECPNIGLQYDFIWFAGCNTIKNLFPMPFTPLKI
jgi:hypothetical protein